MVLMVGGCLWLASQGLSPARADPSQSGSSRAGPLSAQEIVERLPGRWEIDPASWANASENTFRCDADFLRIEIFEVDGRLRYRSSVGPEEQGQVVSDIHGVANPETGELRPLIRLKYEDEIRTTETGELVEWMLVMPDADTFYWIRTDWAPGDRTAMRRRCPIGMS